jgi:hypothetical protein
LDQDGFKLQDAVIVASTLRTVLTHTSTFNVYTHAFKETKDFRRKKENIRAV